MNSTEVSRKKEADPWDDTTIADSYKPLIIIKKGFILNLASFLDFRVSQIPNTSPMYKYSHSFLFS